MFRTSSNVRVLFPLDRSILPSVLPSGPSTAFSRVFSQSIRSYQPNASRFSSRLIPNLGTRMGRNAQKQRFTFTFTRRFTTSSGSGNAGNAGNGRGSSGSGSGSNSGSGSGSNSGSGGSSSGGGFWRWFLGLGPRYPFAFGVAVATIKTPVADLLVQKFVEKRENIDWLRVGVFTAFGFAYLGCFQYWVYVTLFSRFFKNTASFAAMPFRQKLTNIPGLIDLVKQIGVDMLIHGPLFFFPAYYIMRESIQGPKNALNGGSVSEVAVGGLTRYKENASSDLINLWKIWIPGDAVVFALPLWMRLPANHAISFVYVCILSFTRGSADEEQKIVEQKEADK